MTEAGVRAIFTLAGIEVTRVWQLPNGYLREQEPLTQDQIANDRPGRRGCVRRQTEASPGYEDISTEGVVGAWMADYEWRYTRPAWLVKTPYGLIEITERKRVIDIDWRDTPVRAIVTGDETTKDDECVHAWSTAKMVEYLTTWANVAGNLARVP